MCSLAINCVVYRNSFFYWIMACMFVLLITIKQYNMNTLTVKSIDNYLTENYGGARHCVKTLKKAIKDLNIDPKKSNPVNS